MTDISKVKAMQDANWKPSVQYWREKASALRAELDRSEARVAELEGALRPFAKAAELFPEPPGSVEFDQCIYNPAAGKEYSLCGDDLRRVRVALADERKEGE